MQANISATGTYADMRVGNVYYRVQYGLPTELRVYIRPVDAANPVRIDFKRSSQFDGVGVDGYAIYDNYLLTTSLQVDAVYYNSSRETNVIWLRQQDPATGLWSLDEIHAFASYGSQRVSIWSNNIYSNVLMS